MSPYSSAAAAFGGRISDSKQRRGQGQGQWPGAAIRVREGVMVTSGPFKGEGSRWAAEVKGKPVEPVRGTLDLGCHTGFQCAAAHKPSASKGGG